MYHTNPVERIDRLTLPPERLGLASALPGLFCGLPVSWYGDETLDTNDHDRSGVDAHGLARMVPGPPAAPRRGRPPGAPGNAFRSRGREEQTR